MARTKKTASRSRIEKPVLLEVAVRHRPAQRAAGLCSRMSLPKAIGARPRRVHGAQRTDVALAGGGTRFSCFAQHKRTRARGPPRQVAERGTNKPQTHTQRGANSSLRSRVRRVPARASAPPRRGAREQRGAQ
jgi:hypothetical protein